MLNLRNSLPETSTSNHTWSNQTSTDESVTDKSITDKSISDESIVGNKSGPESKAGVDESAVDGDSRVDEAESVKTKSVDGKSVVEKSWGGNGTGGDDSGGDKSTTNKAGVVDEAGRKSGSYQTKVRHGGWSSNDGTGTSSWKKLSQLLLMQTYVTINNYNLILSVRVSQSTEIKPKICHLWNTQSRNQLN